MPLVDTNSETANVTAIPCIEEPVVLNQILKNDQHKLQSKLYSTPTLAKL